MKAKLSKTDIEIISEITYVRSIKNKFNKSFQKLIDLKFYSLTREMTSDTDYTLTATRTHKGDQVSHALFILKENGVF